MELLDLIAHQMSCLLVLLLLGLETQMEVEQGF